MAGHLYSVSPLKRGCKVRIRAKDSDAKQVLFGWGGDYGSTHDRGAIELYGNGTGRGSGDAEIWEWKLSPAGLKTLREGIAKQLREPKKYDVSARENRAARSLLRKIERAEKRLGACARSGLDGLRRRRRR